MSSARLDFRRRFADALAHDGPLDTRALARSFAWAFGVCGTLVLVSLALPAASPVSWRGMLVSALLSYELMLVLMIGDERLPRWIFPLLPLVGAAIVTSVLSWADPATAPAYGFLYLVVALAGFYSFSNAIAIATLCAVPAAYAGAALLRGFASSVVVYWVMTTGVLAVTALLLLLLRQRVDALVLRLREDATTDTLTGVLNRRGLEARLREEVARADRRERPLALAIADLDGFKQVNDVLGHAAGDAVLREFAQGLARSKRIIDAVGRIGGDEFALLLPETDFYGARQALERIRTETQLVFAGREPPLSVTFGMTMHKTREGAPDLLRAADEALYRAKAAGGNRVGINRISAQRSMSPRSSA